MPARSPAAEAKGDLPLPPLERVLVGFDGSDGGRDALELARVLASSHEGASALVVVVFPYGPFPVSFAALQEEAVRDAKPLFIEAREALAGLEVETRVFGGGSPAWVMTDLAEKERVDLIVVGSPHRGPVGRVLLGSVATNLLHGAPCPVAVASRDFAAKRPTAPPQMIAVAYDGTFESRAALQFAEAEALATGASLRLLTVVAPVTIVPGSGGYVPVESPNADKVLARGLSAVSPNVEAEGRRLDGPPGPTLASACEDGVDLLIVGSRGYGPTMRVILGSVSRELVRTSPCPVVVTPRVE